MPVYAKDIMTTDVVCAREDMSAQQLVHLLREHDITGVPVLDATGSLVGVVSMTDIILQDEIFGEGPVMESAYHKQVDMSGSFLGEDFTIEDLADLQIREIMSPDVIQTSPDTPIGELAGVMFSHRIHRVVVVEHGRVAGMVSTMDILKAVMDGISG